MTGTPGPADRAGPGGPPRRADGVRFMSDLAVTNG
jgi:hypothetical protein